jgi:hypothetical protein
MDEEVRPRLETARVASVIDPYRVVINKGAADGVRAGQKYLLYVLGPDVKDPESGESLGQLEVLRGNGTVIHVQERIAIVRSSMYRNRGVAAMLSGNASDDNVPFEGVSKGDFARPI